MLTTTALISRRSSGTGPTTAHLFCGIGGDTAGFAEAGFAPVMAANHSPRNVETHAANFPDTEHLCVDLDHYDMRRLVPATGLWASPICTESTPAGGKRRRKGVARGQTDLLEQCGHVSADLWERTRATAYDILRAVEIWRYDFVACENVIEFATDWELYDWWLEAFRRLGYTITTTCVSSAHIGGETNAPAPQWRDRWYGVFTRNGIPQPDLEPRPPALCPECGPVQARRSWRNPRGPRIGKYRQQYDYRCPNRACRHRIAEPYVRPAISVLDLTNPGRRIGDRPRTPAKPEGLAPSTIARIRDGLARASRGEFDCPPLLVPSGGTWAQEIIDTAASPMRTTLANPKGFETLVTPAPFLAVLRRNATAQSGYDPMPTVVASGGTGGGHLAIVSPDAFVAMLRGNANSRSVMEPMNTVVAAGGASQHALVVPYYSTGVAKPAAAPLDTVTTKARFAIASPTQLSELAVEDCYLRMVQPREYAAGQRFADDYVLTGNQGEQIAGAGNAVSVNVAHWIGRQVMAALEGRTDREDMTAT